MGWRGVRRSDLSGGVATNAQRRIARSPRIHAADYLLEEGKYLTHQKVTINYLDFAMEALTGDQHTLLHVRIQSRDPPFHPPTATVQSYRGHRLAVCAEPAPTPPANCQPKSHFARTLP